MRSGLCGCAVGEQCLHAAPEKRDSYLFDYNEPEPDAREWTRVVPGLPIDFAWGVDQGFTHGLPIRDPFDKPSATYLAGIEYGTAIRLACVKAGMVPSGH
jgi:hypothetical protein